MRIPRDFELPGDEAFIRKEGECLIIEAVAKRSLPGILAALEPLDEEFPEIEDHPAENDVDL